MFSCPRKTEVTDSVSGWGGQRYCICCIRWYMCFNPADNTQGAAIDVAYEMSMRLTTIRLLILSSNYHQNVNCQSVLYIIDCSHCHYWLYASFCWAVNSTCSHPLYVLSLSSGHQLIKWAHMHTHINTWANMLAVTHITACERYWKSHWLTQQTHMDTHLSPSRHAPGQLQSHSAAFSKLVWVVYRNPSV